MEREMLDDDGAINLVIENLKTVKKLLTDLNWDNPNIQKEGRLGLNGQAKHLVFEILQYLDHRRI